MSLRHFTLEDGQLDLTACHYETAAAAAAADARDVHDFLHAIRVWHVSLAAAASAARC